MTTTVTVSPKFQVVIPLVIREALGIRAGQKIQAIQYRRPDRADPGSPHAPGSRHAQGN